MRQPGGPTVNNTFLRNLTKTVLDNLENEQFGVEELASQTGISRSHLHRKLKLLKGKSVSQFIREVRLEEAMKMLQHEVATASEIAYRVGFTSPSYFFKSFQKYYGFPPGEVKKINSDATFTQPGKESDDQNTFEEEGKAIRKKISGKTNPLSKSLAWIITLIVLIGIIAGVSYFLNKGKNDPIVEISIAILPFTNLSTDVENQHFADGLVEDLLNRISRIDGMKVISRTSSEMYREKGNKTIPQIARELGVTHIMEGSVQRDENTARINIQLIDAAKDDHIWSNLFDRELTDIFKMQSEIALQVASELNLILTTGQTNNLRKNYTNNLKAFELYQLGRFYWNKRTEDGYLSSIEYFNQAIEEDPGYALAYAGLADTYNLMAIQSWIDRREGRDKAVELALKALEMDGDLAEAHNVLGSIYTYLDWKWEEAENAYLRAIEINPNYATAHQYYSEHLSITGRHTEARKHINKALELDPLSFVIRYVSVKLYFNRGQFTEALEDNRRSHELNPDHRWSAYYDFFLNYHLGRNQAALQGFKNYGRITGLFNPDLADSIFHINGLDGLLTVYIESQTNRYAKAEGYGFLGDYEKSLELLEGGFDKYGEISPEIAFRIGFKNLYNHPRFIAILKEMGLYPAYTSQLSGK